MRDWWVRSFDARAKAIPPDWDDTLPSDIALQLPDQDKPTVLLTERQSGLDPQGNRPLLFCRKLTKTRDWLVRRGVEIGLVEESGGTRFFTVLDPEGNAIEICEEP